MMKYKGYTAVIEVDEESGMLHGRVIGLRDGIHFQGETVAKAKKSFEESVDDYLNFCASRSEAPEKPFSGKFMVRIPPALHRALVAKAEAHHLSLNALIEQTLADAFTPENVVKPKTSRIKSEVISPKNAVKSKPRPRKSAQPSR